MRDQIRDFRSDTVTQPTDKMRQEMYFAKVGDDVYQDDPTVNELEAQAAEILGKEAALFVTSGTQGNQIALMCHTRRGDEVIVSASQHIFEHEVGAAAVLAGVNLRQVEFADGIFTAAPIAAAIRADDLHLPPTTLICLENALANGRVVPLDNLAEIAALAKARGIAVHLDGARLFNAAAALHCSVREITAHCDSVMCCLSKGLCAPVGSILAGERALITAARKYRKMLGGGLRQAGFLAAAGLLALTEMPPRLMEDHQNARALALLLQEIPGVEVDLAAVQINMVFCRIMAKPEILAGLPAALLAKGIKVNGPEQGLWRFVTHRDVDGADIRFLAESLRQLLS